jgi:hypothetical protein
MRESLPGITKTSRRSLFVRRELIWQEARYAAANRILPLALPAGKLARNYLRALLYRIEKNKWSLAIETVYVVEKFPFHKII